MYHNKLLVKKEKEKVGRIDRVFHSS